MNSTLFVGLTMAFVGALCFAATLFGGGGVAKSQQFRVIREVTSGQQGPRRQRVMIVGLILGVLGTFVAFAGVAARDSDRPRRCREHCSRNGYTRSELGPADVDVGGRRTARVFACRCAREDGATTQVRADDL